MTEIVTPLTDDERAVMMIAAKGNYMMAIGRWEGPVKRLERRGFLQMLDAVNYVITAAGRAALEGAETAVKRELVDAVRRVADAGQL